MQRNINPCSATQIGLYTIMLASMLWGTGNAIAKTIYDISTTNATSIAFLRMALSVPALLLICYSVLGRAMWSFQRRDLPLMLSAGMLVAFYQVAFYASLPKVGVAIATVVALCSAPVIVALLSTFIMREYPTIVTSIALICALIGTGLLVYVQPSSQQQDVFGGVTLALLSATFYAINTLVGRKLGSGQRSHPLQTVTVGFAFGALLLFLFAQTSDLFLTYSVTGWLRLLYLGIVPTAMGYGLFFLEMRTTTASVASIATLMEPLTATVIAITLLHEPLSTRAFIGGGLLLLAMSVLLWARR